MRKKIKHLAIIMDGNRRWAKREGLKSFQGHQKGRKQVEKVVKWCKEANIKILTLYAFSAENWQRPKMELDFLMQSFIEAFNDDVLRLDKEKIKIKVFGRVSGLSKKLQEAIKKAIELTKNNQAGILNLCINYSGRLEIVDAVNDLIKNRQSKKAINEKDLEKYLYSKDIADPDLIIRTSGEKRLSGFLLWQAAYQNYYSLINIGQNFLKKILNRQ